MTSGLAGFEDALLDFGDVSIRTRTAGNGSPLLLLHGTGASVHSWRGLMPLLAQTHTVIAPDEEACARWTEEVHAVADIALMAENSWFRGANIPGKANEFLPYGGSLTKFRDRMATMDEQGYPGIVFGTAALV